MHHVCSIVATYYNLNSTYGVPQWILVEHVCYVGGAYCSGSVAVLGHGGAVVGLASAQHRQSVNYIYLEEHV